jgi:hypothetical protein
MTLARISITLPRDVVAAADRRAAEQDRSRSWVVVESLRAYLGKPTSGRGALVREPAPPLYGAPRPGLGDSRLAQLEADLALTPEQRVREAERTAREGELTSGRAPAARRIVQFDRYEDYLDWKRWEGVSP